MRSWGTGASLKYPAKESGSPGEPEGGQGEMADCGGWGGAWHGLEPDLTLPLTKLCVNLGKFFNLLGTSIYSSVQ